MTWTQPLQIDTLRAHLGDPSLELWMSSEATRVSLREFLIEKWSSEFASPDEVLDLKNRPSGKLKRFSISHCPGLIGFSVSTLNCGLDFERASRVKESIARRVAVEGEMETTPSPAHLWVAKESFFKSIPEPQQPTTISEIKISDWSKNEDGSWSYKSKSLTTRVEGHGAVVVLGSDLLCGLTLMS